MFRVENHGTLCLIVPLTSEVTDWLNEHTDAMWYGDALVCEPRYVEDLVEGMIEQGFQLA